MLGNSTQPTIAAETDYDDQYRFKLWLAAVDDSAMQEMGFRAYHSHILRNLEAWKAEGTKFIDARGNPLIFDVLNTDDLYGFLGKKSEALSGPGRKIKAFKVAVIDVFLKRKFPVAAQHFKNDNVAPALSIVLNDFYKDRKLLPFHAKMSRDKLLNNTGVFIQKVDEQLLERQLQKMLSLHLNILTVREMIYVDLICATYRTNSNHFVVHKIKYPLHIDLFEEESEQYKILKKFNYNPPVDSGEGAIIYSGVGIPFNNFDDGDEYSIICMLKERVLMSPLVANINFTHITIAGSSDIIFTCMERCSNEHLHSYIFYDIFNIDYSNSNFTYNRKFLDDVFKLTKSLGLEV